MGQADQLGVLVQRIVRASRLRVQATDEHEPVDLPAKHLEEDDERALPVAPDAVGAVLVVRIDS